MGRIWKLRLSLMAIMAISLGIMVHSSLQVPDNKLTGLLAFMVFFASAMVLLYTAHVDHPSVIRKHRQQRVAEAGVEHHFRSTGGGTGGGSGC